MFTEPFSEGTSYLHRADPRAKIVAAFVFTLAVAPLHTLPGGILALLLACALLPLAALPLRKLLHRLAAINIFTALLWLFLPFSTPGDPLAQLGPLTLTWQGIGQASLITLKTNAVVVAFIALAATSGIVTMGHALDALGAPRKLTLLFLFTWRYLHVIHQEYTRLHTAALVRGFVPRTDMRTYRTYAYMAAMVLVKSWDRAERVRRAMQLRGFNGQFYRLHSFRSTSGDRALAAAIAITITALLLTDYFAPHLLPNQLFAG